MSTELPLATCQKTIKQHRNLGTELYPRDHRTQLWAITEDRKQLITAWGFSLWKHLCFLLKRHASMLLSETRLQKDAKVPLPPHRFYRRFSWTVTHLNRMPVWNGVDQRVEVKCWEIRIFCFNENNVWSMIPATHNEYEGVLVASPSSAHPWDCCTYQVRWTWWGRLLYRYGKAILYSVLIGCLMIILLMSLNSFQSSSLK